MSTLTTIKEIVEKLRTTEEPAPWMEELAQDSRAGVKTALARWQRNYNKKEIILQEHSAKRAFDESFAPFEGARVAGVDEAGRGPLAGPVVTAAVILPQEVPELVGLDDSKTISRAERQRLAALIRDVAISYSTHVQASQRIDELNIYAATKDSMEQAVQSLAVRPDFVIVDAMALHIDCPTASVIKGDAKSLAVAAASILAKTTRDAIMDQLHIDYPVYHFEKNAGYGTAEHVEALEIHGPCEHHRATFEPVKSMLAKGGMTK
ncbi:ribonuclease HII [Sporosarcina beigongshangi]|uniref:ribonuclease HII n=1 Tax=Sporosarcina beigongshangi TaxID=2782538 RepID=UPI00193A409B|nr:ribonuclease HII [Sporosarcina beigongshangi]